jgi:hypothetical protein
VDVNHEHVAEGDSVDPSAADERSGRGSEGWRSMEPSVRATFSPVTPREPLLHHARRSAEHGASVAARVTRPSLPLLLPLCA